MKAEALIQTRDEILDLLSTYPVLITTTAWFKANDGQQYDAVWGKARILSATALLGFEPAQSTNWLMVIGSGENTLIIGGCQINYLQICPEAPPGNNVLKLG